MREGPSWSVGAERHDSLITSLSLPTRQNPQTARLDIRSIQVYVPYAGAKNAYHFHVSPEGAHGPSVWSRVKGLLAHEEEKVEEIAKE